MKLSCRLFARKALKSKLLAPGAGDGARTMPIAAEGLTAGDIGTATVRGASDLGEQPTSVAVKVGVNWKLAEGPAPETEGEAGTCVKLAFIDHASWLGVI